MPSYSIVHDEDGFFNLMVGHYTIVKIFYKSDRVASPISKEKAEEFINTFKCMVESEYPSDSLNEDDYKPSLFDKFLESLDEEEMESLAKIMALGAVMD